MPEPDGDKVKDAIQPPGLEGTPKVEVKSEPSVVIPDPPSSALLGADTSGTSVASFCQTTSAVHGKQIANGVGVYGDFDPDSSVRHTGNATIFAPQNYTSQEGETIRATMDTPGILLWDVRSVGFPLCGYNVGVRTNAIAAAIAAFPLAFTAAGVITYSLVNNNGTLAPRIVGHPGDGGAGGILFFMDNASRTEFEENLEDIVLAIRAAGILSAAPRLTVFGNLYLPIGGGNGIRAVGVGGLSSPCGTPVCKISTSDRKGLNLSETNDVYENLITLTKITDGGRANEITSMGYRRDNLLQILSDYGKGGLSWDSITVKLMHMRMTIEYIDDPRSTSTQFCDREFGSPVANSGPFVGNNVPLSNAILTPADGDFPPLHAPWYAPSCEIMFTLNAVTIPDGFVPVIIPREFGNSPVLMAMFVYLVAGNMNSTPRGLSTRVAGAGNFEVKMPFSNMVFMEGPKRCVAFVLPSRHVANTVTPADAFNNAAFFPMIGTRDYVGNHLHFANANQPAGSRCILSTATHRFIYLLDRFVDTWWDSFNLPTIRTMINIFSSAYGKSFDLSLKYAHEVLTMSSVRYGCMLAEDKAWAGVGGHRPRCDAAWGPVGLADCQCMYSETPFNWYKQSFPPRRRDAALIIQPTINNNGGFAQVPAAGWQESGIVGAAAVAGYNHNITRYVHITTGVSQSAPIVCDIAALDFSSLNLLLMGLRRVEDPPSLMSCPISVAPGYGMNVLRLANTSNIADDLMRIRENNPRSAEEYHPAYPCPRLDTPRNLYSDLRHRSMTCPDRALQLSNIIERIRGGDVAGSTAINWFSQTDKPKIRGAHTSVPTPNLTRLYQQGVLMDSAPCVLTGILLVGNHYLYSYPLSQALGILTADVDRFGLSDEVPSCHALQPYDAIWENPRDPGMTIHEVFSEGQYYPTVPITTGMDSGILSVMGGFEYPDIEVSVARLLTAEFDHVFSSMGGVPVHADFPASVDLLPAQIDHVIIRQGRYFPGGRLEGIDGPCLLWRSSIWRSSQTLNNPAIRYFQRASTPADHTIWNRVSSGSARFRHAVWQYDTPSVALYNNTSRVYPDLYATSIDITLRAPVSEDNRATL